MTIFSFSWFSCCYGKISDLKQLAYSSSWALSMAGQGDGGGGGRDTAASSGRNREKMEMNVTALMSFSISFMIQTRAYGMGSTCTQDGSSFLT